MSLPPPTTIRPEGIEGELVPLISHDKQQARIPQTATLKKSDSGLITLAPVPNDLHNYAELGRDAYLYGQGGIRKTNVNVI